MLILWVCSGSLGHAVGTAYAELSGASSTRSCGMLCSTWCFRVCCNVEPEYVQGPKFGPRTWKNGAEVRRWLAELAPQGDRSAPEHSVHNPVQLQRCVACF